MAKGQPDVVEPFEQPPARVVVDLERRAHRTADGRAGLEVNGNRGTGLVLEHLPDQFDVVLGDLGRHESLLARVAPEDIGEA